MEYGIAYESRESTMYKRNTTMWHMELTKNNNEIGRFIDWGIYITFTLLKVDWSFCYQWIINWKLTCQMCCKL